jgi:hypothetical protein
MEPKARSLWELTMDPWMDAAHRGVTALAKRGHEMAHGPIQAKELPESPGAPAHPPVHGGGAEMPEEVRGRMETAFSVDFSPVRIHEGPHAEAVGALAYTQGTDIHFAPGQYQPASQRGQELLGHELAHVVQQSQGRVQATAQASGMDINDDASLEREADEMGARAARGEPSRGRSSEIRTGGGDAVVAAQRATAASGGVLQRQVSPKPSAEPVTSYFWQHEEVRARAEAIRAEQAEQKPTDRGLELYMEVVPAVVRAVKGYAAADGKQIPIENAMLIITQGTAEHAPYDPNRLDKPVIPPGNMLWGVTSASEEAGATVRTDTHEERNGASVLEKNRKFRAYGSMEDAAVGYLRALEGTDPDAAQNPNYKRVLDVLTTPGATPQQFGAVLGQVGWATARHYGSTMDKKTRTAKHLITKFMPQILQGQQDKIDALQAKAAAYQELIAWIEQRAAAVQGELEALAESSEASVALEEELRQLETDHQTAMGMIERLEPLVAKEQQLLADLGEFAGTLSPRRP